MNRFQAQNHVVRFSFFLIFLGSLAYSQILESTPGDFTWNITPPKTDRIMITQSGVEYPGWSSTVNAEGFTVPVMSRLIYTRAEPPVVNTVIGDWTILKSPHALIQQIEQAKGVALSALPSMNNDPSSSYSMKLISSEAGLQLWAISIMGAAIPSDGNAIHIPESIQVTISTDLKTNASQMDRDLYLNRTQAAQLSLGKMSQDNSGLSKGKLKIQVLEDGIYRVHYESLLEVADFPATPIESQTIRLINRGEELPIYVFDGGDNRFDGDDYFDFIGKQNYYTGSSQYYDPFSDINTYWLDWGVQNGLRFVEESGALVDNEPVRPSTFWDVVHIEKDSLFDRLGQVDTDLPTITRDHYFWNSVNSGQNSEVDFFLAHPFRGSSENLEISIGLHGLTYSLSAGEDSEHTLFAFLNDNSIGEGSWTQQEQYTLVSPSGLNLSHNILSSAGENTLAVFAPVNTEPGKYDRIVLDWIEIAYEHLFTALNDALRFRKSKINPATSLEFEVNGFSSPNLVLYKEGVSKITGYSIREIWDVKKPTFNLVFQDEVTDATPDYWASNVETLLKPLNMVVDTLASLRDLDGDFVIITIPEFMDGIDEYIDFKIEEGWNPVLVSLTDIYDEFNYGINSPYAIKSFLKYANNHWPSKPEYALLIGDAISDPQAAKQDTRLNHIPTFYMQTYGWGAAEADYWYSLINGDDLLSDVHIGRIPCNDRIELDMALSKLIAYGQGGNYGSWQNELITIAGFESTFKSQSQSLLKNEVPKSYMPSRIFIDRDSEGQIFWGDTDSLISLWNDGKLLINFLGHGGGAVWADRSLFVRDDISFLNADAAPAFVTSMTCFTASFAQVQGLGEVVLTQSPAGSIGWFGSSGVGWLINDYLMVQPMLRRLLEEHKPVGEIITTARTEYFLANSGYDYLKPSMLFQYNFLGDPTTRLALPEHMDLLTSAKNIYSGSEQLDLAFSGTDEGTLKVLPVNALGDPWWVSPQSFNTTALDQLKFDQDALSLAGESRTIFTLDRGPDLPAIQGFAAYSVSADWFEHQPPTADELENSSNIPIRVKYHSDLTVVDSMVLNFLGANTVNQDLILNGEWWSLPETFDLNQGYGNTYYYFSAFNSDTLVLSSSTYRLYLPEDLSLSLNGAREGTKGKLSGIYIDYSLGGSNTSNGTLVYSESSPRYTQSFQKDVTFSAGNNSIFIPSYFGSGEVNINVTVHINDVDSVDNSMSVSLTPSLFQVIPGLGLSFDSTSVDSISLWSNGSLYISSSDSSWIQVTEAEQNISSTSGVNFYSDSTVYMIKIAESSMDIRIKSDRPLFLKDPHINSWQLLESENNEYMLHGSGLLAMGEKRNTTGPKVSLMMEGQLFFDGDYILEKSRLNLIAEDEDGFTWKEDDIAITLDGAPLEIQLGDTTEAAKVIGITADLDMDIGAHTIAYSVSDALGNWSSEESIQAVVAGDAQIIDYGNFPNPFQGETLIIYELTQPLDDVIIEIYTLSGYKLFKIDEFNARVGIPLGAIGYHEVPWNGRDQNEDFVANGVYFYRISGKIDDQHLTGPVGKMVKIR